ncbi:hypothetical protein PROFUN_15962 [Planoprotostelium fungivorum]|uniref:Uncharacterized protein n=1 Tax=Planoprotostelium fungivorum TaxID=1890364 RepID=A0A2P6MU21_9EUKA|nr:hypothetical protein PROFUN_15962 [Planoprotostelium fungivorum]
MSRRNCSFNRFHFLETSTTHRFLVRIDHRLFAVGHNSGHLQALVF